MNKKEKFEKDVEILVEDNINNFFKVFDIFDEYNLTKIQKKKIERFFNGVVKLSIRIGFLSCYQEYVEDIKFTMKDFYSDNYDNFFYNL